ncbi:single-stranded-DNA-specific exonuclease RecJ [Thiohalomonas denitrificans]|uniref:Single-stranded-DNA-specific exonuclease RecJ n=1 Tax=Thiohalomonas denitrificans TaxID=415747 RepID=A0A1G5Q359_9GAMM|nr:single-stranded-DNA-specific exonuclease RecJ [Thiohalomonas denitrificans]SCZ56107.1 single-stranded-DNA-specific exonuclease [Thiohalomonas denitrificans]
MPLSGRKRIVRRETGTIPAALADLNPVLARVCAGRRVRSMEELEHGLERLLPFDALKGIGGAVRLLERALREGWSITVVGDFDADGATSTAVAVRALRSMGVERVDFLVPNRFEYGYGLTPEIVAVVAARRPDLIVTVDNGISSLDGVAAAKAAGMRVLVTDHHLPGEHLPEADAMVNPNQPGDRFASKALAGVGVIFYVMLALRAHLREQGWFEQQGVQLPNLAHLLDLVALGTVADVVPLEHNNRILVAQGLGRIRAGKGSPGIQALIEIANRKPERLVSSDFGFAIGPRLNAAGRMDDMSVGIRCLLSDDLHEARELAAELEGLNRARRETEQSMREEAMQELQRMHLESDGELPFGLCLYEPAWHEGVIGILASRIKERVHRPVIVFTDAGTGDIKGSARSVPGVHIRDALNAIAARTPAMLKRFGGHAMAAGLTLDADALEEFRRLFDSEVRRHLNADDLNGVVASDGPLEAEAIDLDLADTLRMAVPWGQGFPEPVFDDRFEVVSQRIVGERHMKLLLKKNGSEGHLFDAIAFNADLAMWETAPKMVDAAFRLDVNEYRGRRSVQFIIEHIEPAAEGTTTAEITENAEFTEG